jgi:hypothetical protein
MLSWGPRRRHSGVDAFAHPRLKAACYWLLPRTANKEKPFGYPDMKAATYDWRDYGEWLRMAAWAYKVRGPANYACRAAPG